MGFHIYVLYTYAITYVYLQEGKEWMLHNVTVYIYILYQDLVRFLAATSLRSWRNLLIQTKRCRGSHVTMLEQSIAFFLSTIGDSFGGRFCSSTSIALSKKSNFWAGSIGSQGLVSANERMEYHQKIQAYHNPSLSQSIFYYSTRIQSSPDSRNLWISMNSKRGLSKTVPMMGANKKTNEHRSTCAKFK